MARKKAYSKKLAVLDIVLIFLTAGTWMFVMLVRELYMRS